MKRRNFLKLVGGTALTTSLSAKTIQEEPNVLFKTTSQKTPLMSINDNQKHEMKIDA